MEIGQGSPARDPADHREHGRQQPARSCPARPPAAASASAAAASMTLTPEDAEAIAPRVPGRRRRRRPSSAPARRSSTATRTGCRSYIYGTTPDFLDVRDWDELDEGERFTDRDVRNASQGLPARPDARPRAVRRRVADRQGGPRQQRAVQGHRRPEPQGRQHDGHGPGRHPAGPVDDHQVPRVRPVGARRSTRAPPAGGGPAAARSTR